MTFHFVTHIYVKMTKMKKNISIELSNCLYFQYYNSNLSHSYILKAKVKSKKSLSTIAMEHNNFRKYIYIYYDLKKKQGGKHS